MITSPANPTIKEIRSLRVRKYRQAVGLAWVEGIRQVIEAGSQPGRIDKLIHCESLLTSPLARDWLSNARQIGIPILEVDQSVFESLAVKESPVGLAAVVHQVWSGLPQVLDPCELWVVLEAVADPGNLGTILRTLDAVNGEGVILLEGSTDPYDPTAIRASMGAVFTQNLVRTTRTEFTHWIEKQALPLVGTSDRGAQDYHEFAYPSPCVILMGSERQGLNDALQALCRQVVAIPMAGKCDSLNLAVAASLILYEVFNQRRRSGGNGI